MEGVAEARTTGHASIRARTTAMSRAVPAFISGEYLTGGVGQLPALDYVAVLVPESSVELAESIVREIDHALAEAREAIRELDDDPDSMVPQPV